MNGVQEVGGFPEGATIGRESSRPDWTIPNHPRIQDHVCSIPHKELLLDKVMICRKINKQ